MYGSDERTCFAISIRPHLGMRKAKTHPDICLIMNETPAQAARAPCALQPRHVGNALRLAPRRRAHRLFKSRATKRVETCPLRVQVLFVLQRPMAAATAKQRLPTLLEVLQGKSGAPLSYESFYEYLQLSWNEDAMEFWVEAQRHEKLCVQYITQQGQMRAAPHFLQVSHTELINNAEQVYQRYLLSGDHEVLFPYDVRIQIPTQPVPSGTELLHMFEAPKKYVFNADAATYSPA